MNDNSEKKKVFISYAREDIITAKKLYHDLKKVGADPWMDTTDLLGGQRWQATIRDAIKDSSYFLALLSENSVSKKGFIQKELKLALDELSNYPPDEIYIVPVRLDDSEPKHNELKELHRIDIFPSYGDGLKEIYRVIVPVPVCRLRSEPETLSDDDIRAMFAKHNLYTGNFNDNGDGTITDSMTCLVWEKAGSDNYMTYDKTQAYIDGLNRNKFAGYDDWRLPTLEELVSLLESKKVKGRYIDSVLDCKGYGYWTADKRVSGVSISVMATWVGTGSSAAASVQYVPGQLMIRLFGLLYYF
ncbi:MAG: TIR domain-containing protein [Desulfobacterales bacterium]|nr:TIR domain-containing protein [Desulfobacterales bacterium]